MSIDKKDLAALLADLRLLANRGSIINPDYILDQIQKYLDQLPEDEYTE